VDPNGHSKCPAHSDCIVDYHYAPFKGNCDVCMRRFHLVERADKVEDRKVLGRGLLDWFFRNLVAKKHAGVVWDDDLFHLCYLAQLRELSKRKLDWMSIDQRIQAYGFTGPVSDGLLRRTAALRLQLYPQGSRRAYQVSVVWGFREVMWMFPSSHLDLLFLWVWG